VRDKLRLQLQHTTTADRYRGRRARSLGHKMGREQLRGRLLWRTRDYPKTIAERSRQRRNLGTLRIHGPRVGMPLCEPAPSFENVREGNRRIGAARQHEGLIWKPFAGPSSKETRPPLSPMPERNPKLKGLAVGARLPSASWPAKFSRRRSCSWSVPLSLQIELGPSLTLAALAFFPAPFALAAIINSVDYIA
jgi:hypothetical protein